VPSEDTMKNQMLRWTAAGALATAALGASAHAQSADALIDKLVQKGVLTVKEANELREEADKDFKTAYQVKSGMPDWVDSLKFSGDFRGRFEGFFGDGLQQGSAPGSPDFVDRYRWRYRLRFGAVATLKQDFEVGFRLTSSDAVGTTGGDPISGNTTFNNDASKKFIYIDQAYVKWAPLHTADWTGSVTFGKMENPFVFSDMVFDPDYTPEGGALQASYNLGSGHSLKLNTGAFVLSELGGSPNDPWMFGSQLLWDATWQKKLTSSLGVALLSIAKAESLSNAQVPNVNRGNTRDGLGIPVYNFNPIVADAALTYTLDSFPVYTGTFPIKLSGEYTYNPAAPNGADNFAYNVGIQFGKAGKKQTWEASYTWKYLGGNSWYEEVVDSDFGAYYQDAQPNSGLALGYGAGTNAKGHIVKVAYSPYDFVTLSVKWYYTSLIEPVPASSNNTINRLQVDASFKF
jgi:hypothetical protein